MTVIMYLAELSQSCVVNTASQSSLRERMTRNLQLRGLGAYTQEAYLRAVRQLAAFYRPTPNQFNEEQLREYFLRLKNHNTYSKSVR
jgi:integrase/recombinase XerD